MDDYKLGNEVFVWGVLAYDNFNTDGCTPSMRTMNDLDITYNTETKLYSLSIETIYMFKSIKDELCYIINLLDKFTDWMDANGYSTNQKVTYASILNCVNSIPKFTSVEQAYAWFKFNVINYIRMYDFE